ncbi:MAG: hypothetical protein K6B75_05400 [Lachnospiraceae bacterium]|nr:hypothetical protein [Lachnospiraceae bacterium]
MRKKDLNNLINDSFSMSTPDNLDKIKAACEKVEQLPPLPEAATKSAKRRAFRPSLVAAYASFAFLLVIGFTVGKTVYDKNNTGVVSTDNPNGKIDVPSTPAPVVTNTPAATPTSAPTPTETPAPTPATTETPETLVTSFYIDVNPSIRVDVADDLTVVSYEALNSDAAAILSDLSLTGLDVYDALNHIVISLYDHGYLQDSTDTMLISVDEDSIVVETSSEGVANISNPSVTPEITNVPKPTVTPTEEEQEFKTRTSETLLGYILNDVNSIISDVVPECTVVGQTIHGDKVKEEAEENNVSVGKMWFIESIVDSSDTYTADDYENLAENSIKSLGEMVINFGLESFFNIINGNDRNNEDDNKENHSHDGDDFHNKIKEDINETKEKIKEKINESNEKIKDNINNATEKANEGANDVTNEAIDEVNDVTNEVIDEVNDLTNDVIDEVNDVTNEVIDGVNDVTNEVIDGVSDLTNEIINGINDLTNDIFGGQNPAPTDSPKGGIEDWFSGWFNR